MNQHDLMRALVCPVTRSRLHAEGNYLVSEEGRRYPVVRGIPVMLVPSERQTMSLADASRALADRIASGEGEDEYCVDSLGLSDEQKAAVRTALARETGDIDPVISYLVGATNGIAYKDLIGRLESYPIPELRLPGSAGGVLLDIGCNWGRWSISAARKGYQSVGIDPSLGAVLAAKRLADRLGVGAAFVVGDARFLPFAEGFFDTCFSYSVIQHFYEHDAESAVAEIGRVLKPGGVALVQMPTTLGIRCLWHQARRGFREPTGFDVRYYSIPALTKMFSDRIGPSAVSIDCFFGIGLQPADMPIVPFSIRSIIRLSEFLRTIGRAVPALRYVADSVYVTSRKQAL